jgi:hypothetical protein
MNADVQKHTTRLLKYAVPKHTYHRQVPQQNNQRRQALRAKKVAVSIESELEEEELTC